MITVWKYTLAATDHQVVDMPFGAKILSAEEQNNQIVIYALIEPEETSIFEQREIVVLGTGHVTNYDLLKEYIFLNTVKMNNGELMFHVFYKKGFAN